MNRKLVFLRHGKVALPYESHDDMPFDVLCALGNQTMDPPSDIVYLESRRDYLEALFSKFNFSKIFRSPSRRCSTLEQYLNAISSRKLPKAGELKELREIFFELNILFPSQRASLEEISPRLIEEILTGGPGAEPLENILRRFNHVVDQIPLSGDVLILTHGFFMRLIASTYENSGNSADPTITTWEDAPRFKYLEGFVLEQGKPIEYILSS